MTDYANSRLASFSKPWTRAAMYRLVESEAIEVKRLGAKGATIIATVEAVDKALGLQPSYSDSAERQAA